MEEFKFDQLPDLCLRKIFACLRVQDLVKCRAVNGLFKNYAERTQMTEQVVRDDKHFPYGWGRFGSWYQRDGKIDFQDAISSKTFASSLESSLFRLHQQVKFLMYTRTSQSIDCKILNDLKQLVHLELDSLDDPENTLALPNLRVLCIANWASIILEAPKLEVLRCNWMNEIQLKHPETIKQVKCSKFDKNYEDLLRLSNLEVLQTSLFVATELNEVPDRLSNLPGLKELHLEFKLYSYPYCDSEEQFFSSLNKLLHERAASKRDDLKISLEGMLLIDGQLPNFEIRKAPHFDRKVDLEEWINGEEHRFRLQDYRLLAYADTKVTELDYCEMAALNFEISSDFFERFPRIRTIIANNTVDREQFEWFLQHATELRVLKLDESTLGQAFFDCLPEIASRLIHLEVYESFGLITDFRFLLHLKQLEEFEINRAFHSFDQVATVFEQSQNLRSLSFRIDKEVVKIRRSSVFDDDYSLQFFAVERNKEAVQMFHREQLRLSEVESLYASRTASPPEIRMRVKPAQLK